jgi:phosphoribosylformylglycinamidine (FGAM) synthase-like amidotransferase family enzyme
MKAAVILLPGLNRDRDMIAALTKISGQAPQTVWQTETSIDDDVDLIVIPGGFSYGDYLRCGAIAARMPVMKAVREKAARACASSACATASRSCSRQACCPAR